MFTQSMLVKTGNITYITIACDLFHRYKRNTAVYVLLKKEQLIQTPTLLFTIISCKTNYEQRHLAYFKLCGFTKDIWRRQNSSNKLQP